MLLHDVNDETGKVMTGVRYHFLSLMTTLADVLPVCKETSRAINSLDDALRESISALARHQDGLDLDASHKRLMDMVNATNTDTATNK